MVMDACGAEKRHDALAARRLPRVYFGFCTLQSRSGTLAGLPELEMLSPFINHT